MADFPADLKGEVTTWQQKREPTKLECGLLGASFRPKGELAALRAYLRQRERLLDYAASHIQHMQKSLMQMNVQLHHVVTDITGATGMRIIRAIIAGERDPGVAPLRPARSFRHDSSSSGRGRASPRPPRSWPTRRRLHRPRLRS